MITKISIGFVLGAVVSVTIALVLENLLAPARPDVPYGSNMLMPIFYLGILGAVVGAMTDLISRSRIAQAAATGLIGGGIVGKIMLGYWLTDYYPLFHYSNVIIYMPVVVISGLVILLSTTLVLRLALSRGRNATR